MQLFDESRPQVSPDNPALLLDGSAVPQLSIWPTADGKIQVTVFLRNYRAKGRSYKPHIIDIGPERLLALLTHYVKDPEWALEHYFHWSPEATEDMRAAPVAMMSYREAMDIL